MDRKQVDRSRMLEVFQQVWSQALVAVTGAEEEVAKVIGRLQEGLGWTQEEARKQVREFAERLAGQRRDIEGRVEEAVRLSMARLKVPRREEIAQLSVRVEELTRRLEALTR